MVGMTALISTLLGLLSGIVPDVLKEVRDTRASAREREFLELQHRMQLERLEKAAGDRLAEAETNVVAEEMRATRAHLTAIIEAQARPTGVTWIDALNAALRPLAALLILVVFIAGSAMLVGAHVTAYTAGQLTAQQAVDAMFGGLVGTAIEAVLGFLFGARQARKPPVEA